MQIIKKHFDTLHMHAKNHLEKLDAHVQKHAPKAHAHIKKAHEHLSKPAKHHHYWLALCGIILRSSVVTYTNSSFARQSLQDQFVRPTKSVDFIQFEPIDTINTLNPRNNLTGAYTGGDIIISDASFIQTLPNGTVGPLNTILSTGSDAPLSVNITFKNIGATPLYIPLTNINGSYGHIIMSCQGPILHGGCLAKVAISSLTQGNYLLPGQTIQGTIQNHIAGNRFGYPYTNTSLVFTVVSQQEQSSNNPQPITQSFIFETNGQNNSFTINYIGQNYITYTAIAGSAGNSNGYNFSAYPGIQPCSCQTSPCTTSNSTLLSNDVGQYCYNSVYVGGSTSNGTSAGGSATSSWQTTIYQKQQSGGFDLTITDITSSYNQQTDKLSLTYTIKNIGNQNYSTIFNNSGTLIANIYNTFIENQGSSLLLYTPIGQLTNNGSRRSRHSYQNHPSLLAPGATFTQTLGDIDTNATTNGNYHSCHKLIISNDSFLNSNVSHLAGDTNLVNNTSTHCFNFTKTSVLGYTGNNGYGYGYGYGYTNGYGYGYGYGYRYAKGHYANSPIFYLTKPYIMISQSVWTQYQNINLLPTKMKKLAAGTIEKLFDGKALLRMASELQTSFDRTKQKIDTMKSVAKNKIVTDYQKARKLFEDGYTALFKKKGLWNKDAEQAIKKSNTKLAPIEVRTENTQKATIKSDSKVQTINNPTSTEQKTQATKSTSTKKDSILKRMKDKMRQLIKDKIKQVKSN